MLDRVSTVVLGLDGTGRSEAFADYSQWEQWRGIKPGRERVLPEATAAKKGSSSAGSKKKLSYLEAREFEGIEAAVDAADARLETARDCGRRTERLRPMPRR